MNTAPAAAGRLRTALTGLVIAITALTGCGAGVPAATPTPDVASPSPTPTPTPSPTPEPVAQAFGGDCDAALIPAELVGVFGTVQAPDPLVEARQALFEEASIVASGGIVCDWRFEEVGVTLTALPAAMVPPELNGNDFPCSDGFVGCSWKAVQGEWWVNVDTWPVVVETWQDDASSAELVAGLASDRVQEWSAPVASAPIVEADCAALLVAADAAAAGSGLEQSGWGITGVKWIANATKLVTGCAWSDSQGMVDLLIQPNAGPPSSDALDVLAATPVNLPGGGTAAQISLTPEFGSVVAHSGDLRISISGKSAAVDPARVAAILSAVLGELG